MRDVRALVVYYSRTGTTKKVAEAIAKIFGCDIEEVLDLKERTGVLGWLRSGREASSKKLTTIEKMKRHPDLYDIVIIGTPVWCNTMSTPIRTYISQYGGHFREVAFFCTQYGSENSALKDMEVLCGKKPVASLKLRREEVKSGEYVDKAKQFCAKIMDEILRRRI
jgi:flavodoxin